MNQLPNPKPQQQPEKLHQTKLAKLMLFSVSIPLAIAGGHFLLKNVMSAELKQEGIAIENSETPPNDPFRDAVNQAMRAAILTQSAKNKNEWEIVTKHWKNAIAQMSAVPSSSNKYTIAQKKVVEYQRNLNYATINFRNSPIAINSTILKQPQRRLVTNNISSSLRTNAFRDAVNQAMNAAILTQSAQSQTEWDKVVSHWQNAIALLKVVPSSSNKYAIAQRKIIEYQRNLNYAMVNLTRAKLNEAQTPIASKPEVKPDELPSTVSKPEVKPDELPSTASKPEVKPDELPSTISSNPFRDAVNQATQAAILTQSAKSKPDWENVVNQWKNAIAQMKAVPSDSDKYTIAQQKIIEYDRNLNYAQLNSANAISKMTLKKTILGSITPKSVVASGSGLFFAQNMMYSHTITVYDRNYKLVKTIPDSVDLSKYGHKKFKGLHRGAPVEAAFSHNGKYAWISNYQMYGSGFNNPGSDRCSPSGKHDPSFLYRLNTETLAIEAVIQVGAVPKYVGVSPDNRLVLVSNWCTWDLSVIDTEKNTEIRRVKLGAYPRGIVVDPTAKKAYIAVMGSSDIAKVNLDDFSVKWLRNMGAGPRHLNIDPAGKYLYVTLNNEGRVGKIDLSTEKVLKKVVTGTSPRSMTISANGDFLYVVNYHSNTVSKVRTSDMKTVQTVKVNSDPIGITYDSQSQQVWVACYSGSILVFQE